MGIIKILPAEVAGRIAAGEVIERPASVIKELVENSIDAGATRIRVVTEQGGQKLMQVVDNGKGMDREDAIMCLSAHATSKISHEGDVGQIVTLGFRGEALPSISSVSRFEMQTRMAEQLTGTEVIVNNGVIQDVRDCGCAPGTSIKVAWLFGNLPARRKFLKGPATEDDHIQEMILLLALSRPDIAFELVQNGRSVIRVPASNDLGTRIQMLLGADAFAAMLPVDYAEDGIRVRGFISKPGFTRSNRRDQRVVVNGRAASAETVFFAIREAYDTLVMKGRYPGVVLYLDLAPDRVDVNVHPAKREVRFREPMRVAKVVGTALRNALRNLAGLDASSWDEMQNPFGDPPKPEAEAESPILTDTTPKAEPSQPEIRSAVPPPVATPAPIVFQPIQSPLPFAPTASQPPIHPEGESEPLSCTTTVPAREEQSQSHAMDVGLPNGIRLLGPLHQGYLLAEGRDGLIVVNVRAASQRILFERMLANLKQKKVVQQALLIPLTINLAVDEARLLSRQLEHFAALGYTIEEFGGNAFVITAVPANLPDSDLGTAMRDILSDLRRDTVTNRQSAMHLAQTASRYAVRVKQELSPMEQQTLLRDLLKCEMPYADASGLPTMVHITYSELQKRFKS
ncbi:MAG: DNA mismatch repair endonuclease MutL [Victivallales bacterium]|nr:DNA mismatch repair endonuclease MutL [Victivallales bacterium]